MKKVMFMIGAAATLLLASCKSSPKAEERVCNIYGGLQDSVVAILQKHLSKYDAMDGVAIVMETNSGRIRAMVGLECREGSSYVRADSLAGIGRSSALMRTISMLAALNSGMVTPNTKVDTEEGVYVCGKDTIFDHNWRRGGYGELTLCQVLALGSNVGTVKAVDKAFADKKQFFDNVKKMSFGLPREMEGLKIDSCSQNVADLPWYYFALGNKETAPIQMLTFYNAIANNGKMVAPLLYELLRPIDEDPQVLNPQIASPSSITAIREMLEENITKGLGKRAMSDLFPIEGVTGTIYNKDSTLTADFCGYFPMKNTVYTVLVSVHRKERPASGGVMAGTIFKEIAEFLYHHKDIY